MSNEEAEDLQQEFGEQPDSEVDRSAMPVGMEQPPRLAFPVVGVGASAGGLEAFFEFLQATPPNTGMAYVLVQHLPPDHESMLPEILARRTQMSVHQVEDGMQVQPDQVYVIRPDHSLLIKDGRLKLGAPLKERVNNRPVDDFFRALAEEQRERAIAVILSGMGSNGTAGAQAIKAVGGLCIAQDPETAQFASMPRHLIEAGYADYILRPADIPEVLQRYARHPYARREQDTDDLLRREQHHVREILAILRTRTQQDFTGYKKPTVLRRIQRRMGLTQLTNVRDYAKLLRQNPAEVHALRDDLLIHVTGFFRDAEAWEALRERVIVPLVASREADTSIRCWVSACSSGEEAYTLAMLLLEESDRLQKSLDIKVFATDTAERTLADARQGIYPGGIETEMPLDRMERFFERDDAVYRVRQDLRERVVFAPQNVLQDPPFSRLDIVTCRNLLIYLEPNIQQRVLSMLHFGLRDGGALFLGSSETASGAESMFEVIDKKAKIYRRIGPTRHGAIDFPLPRPISVNGNVPRADTRVPRPSIAQLTNKALLARHVPAAVTVDRDHRIVYYHGDTNPYLEHPTGEPVRDLLLLARESVRGAVRTALQRVAERAIAVTVPGGWVDTSQGRRRVYVTASPLDIRTAPDSFVVSFEQHEEAAAGAAELPAGMAGRSETHDDLQRIRDELQSTIEELQTSNEEHRAASEEVMSINEELQSANEELETSKEELQSLNEELSTVNSQLQAKIEEHQSVANDLSSLLASTDIAVLFLDTRLRIRRFTPAVKDLLDLIGSDVGRPLSDMAWKFADAALVSDIQMVLERLVPIEREILAHEGRWYIRRVLPYRTADNRIDGVVVTFVDINESKRAAASLAEQARLLDLSNDAIIVRNIQNRIIYWNRGATELYGWTPDQAIGEDYAALLRAEREPPLAELVERLQKNDRLVDEVISSTRDGRRIVALCRWSLDRDNQGQPAAILTSTIDITSRRQAEEALHTTEEHFRLLVEGARDFAMFMLDAKGRITTWNLGAERVLGWSQEEAIGQSGAIIFTPEDRAAGAVEHELVEARRHGRCPDERWHVTKDGRLFWASGVLSALRDERGELRGYVKVIRDETARRRAEDLLRSAKDQAENANRIKDDFLARLSHELRTPLSVMALWPKLIRKKLADQTLVEQGIEAIEKAAESQASLIDDLLDTSRIVSGKLRLDLAPTQLAEMLQTAVEAIQPAASAKGVQLELIGEESPTLLMADPNRLKQVLWNLLTNAVKFTPKGGRVTVRLEENHSFVDIHVADTGEGISPDFLPHVFEQFRQAESAAGARHGGLGLGLTISKELVQMHGGTLSVQSEGLGKGSTFTVRLPKLAPDRLSQLSPSSRVAQSDASLQDVRILLVEDDAETQKVMTMVLAGMGAEVTTASSGQEALDALARDRPDLLMSDVGLDDFDGLELIARIRSQEKKVGARRLPAIAVSAYVREDDSRRSIDAGFDAHLGKPIDPHHLASVVKTFQKGR